MDWSKHFSKINEKVYDVVFFCFHKYKITALEKLGQLRDSSVSETHAFLQNYFSQYQWFVFDVDTTTLATNTWYDKEEESKYRK